MNKLILKEDWYQQLVEECKSIITEAVFTSRWALVEGYWQLGKRIREDNNFTKFAKGNKSSVTDLAQNIGKSDRTLYRAISIYENYKELDLIPEGKNISLNKLLTKYIGEHNLVEIPRVPTKDIILIEGDVLKVELPEVDVVLTDPPYNTTEIEWDKIGTRQEYLDFTQKWISSLKWKKHFFVFCSPKYMADYEMILRELEYPIKSRIIWVHKNMSMGKNAKDKFINCYDIIFHCGLTNLELPQEWTEERFDVKEFANPQTNFTDIKLHQTQKPKELLKELLRLSTKQGDTVLDCFAGSGSTGVVANELGLKCYLVEKEPKFIKLIKKHLCL